jgi:hypothetical protein
MRGFAMTTIDNTNNTTGRRGILRTATMSLAAAGITVAAMLAFSREQAISADKYTVQIPNGLSFSEFKGFEDWPTIAVSQTGDLIEVIIGNATMIEAYRSGVPGNGKPFPDGSKSAKIHWNAKQSAEAPQPTTIPDTLHDINFMVKDSKRFPSSGGWGYAQFNYDTQSDTFTPFETGFDCGHVCHTIVAAKDYVFTAYGKR